MNAQSCGRGATRRAARLVAWLLSLLWFASMSAAADMNLGGMFSDLWWNSPAKSEDGWGMTVDHQDQVMFITLYIYRADTSSYWAVATLTHVDGSRYSFTGDLYDAHGPWFGGPYSPPYVPRKMGTATFTAPDPLHATLSYTVDGTPVNKTLERQTLRNLNFSGTYLGAITFVTSNCTNPVDNNDVTSDAGPMTITQSGTSVAVAFTGIDASCNFGGTYTQSGGLGSLPATVSCTGGIAGTLNLASLQWTAGGLTATVTGRVQNCDVNGAIAGAVRSR